MTTPIVPYSFQTREGTIKLKELDDNFEALAASSLAPASVFDGGLPTTSFSAGAHLDAGNVT